MQNPFKKYKPGTIGGLVFSLVIATLIFLTIGISYFYIYLPSSTNHGESITVPDVQGMQIAELEKFLLDRNLRYAINDSSYSADYEPLTVLKQFPAAGVKVKENRNILITINRITPPTVPLPNLIDGSLINAEAVMRGSELKRGRIQLVRGPFLNLVKEMHFNGRKIEPGTRVPKGSVIDLVVEDGGSNEIPTPNVVGYTLEDAKIPIFGSNLHIGEIIVVGDTVDNGPIVILKQYPLPQTKMRAGDVIDVWVGKKGTEVVEEDETDQDEG
ncbi:MAG: PASTA domain-containing protein [Cytophagia bacterium]|nr:PASTA domain-containing protein [Cytophagia bacterium]NBW36038.1 PASTA domain-containing protein [Cytophagia bacterium]